MPVPKRKRSRARRDSRFANKAMDAGSIVACTECKSPVRPHVACLQCGFYGGRKILVTKNERLANRTLERAKRTKSVEATQADAV